MKIERVLALLDGVRGAGASQWIARCPAHDDRTASLSVGVGDDGRTLLTCHASCDVETIAGRLGITVADLFAEKSPSSKATVAATYDYRDETGELLYVVERTQPKGFRQKRPNGSGGWVWSMTGVRRVPYMLPELLEGVKADRWVFVVEGERDVETLTRLGFVATTNSGGAAKWHPDFATLLKAARVVIVGDNDEPGRKHVQIVAAALQPHASVVRVLDLPGLAEHGDVTDWVSAGGTAAELNRLVADAPQWAPPGRGEGHSLPPVARATAQPLPVEPPALAFQPRILDRFRDEVRLRGLVGEERNAETLYLVITSRLLDRQVSAGVKGHSSSGKSYAVEQVLDFFPPEAVIVFTAFSEKALIYSTQDFRHRCLVIYEITGLREGVEDDLTSYFVRTLLSEGRIDYEVTVRAKDGGFTTKKIVKEGPTNLVFTTTKTRVHSENETRVLSLHTDDSTAQTARVFLELANEGINGGRVDEWLQLQRWLEQADHEVTIPFARRLAESVQPVAVRLRRDFGSLLALIRAHAVLHQATRRRDDHGRIVATLDDYEVVRGLVADTIAEGVEATVSPIVRGTVAAVVTCATDQGGVTALAVARHLTIDKSNASRRLRRAADAGYLTNLEDRRGKPARWVIADALPEDVDLLPQPHNLEDHETAGQSSGCAVALVPEGIGSDNRHGDFGAWTSDVDDATT